MSYRSLLTNTCDIYNLKTRDGESSFGIPSDDLDQEFYYDDIPDEIGAYCYITENNQNIIQMDPNNNIIQSFKAHFMMGALIEVNSKVAWNGMTLKAQQPRNVKGHHQVVTLLRDDNL